MNTGAEADETAMKLDGNYYVSDCENSSVSVKKAIINQ